MSSASSPPKVPRAIFQSSNSLTKLAKVRIFVATTAWSHQDKRKDSSQRFGQTTRALSKWLLMTLLISAVMMLSSSANIPRISRQVCHFQCQPQRLSTFALFAEKSPTTWSFCNLNYEMQKLSTAFIQRCCFDLGFQLVAG